MAKSLRLIGISSRDYRVKLIKDGDPIECTRLLRLVLLQVSLEVATQILPAHTQGHSRSAELSDKKFMNIVFRYLREQSKYFPVLSPVQYHLKGFGEHKMHIIDAAAKHVSLYLENGGERVPTTPQQNPAGVSGSPTSSLKKASKGKGKRKGAKRRVDDSSSGGIEGPMECSEDISEVQHNGDSKDSGLQRQPVQLEENHKDGRDEDSDSGSTGSTGQLQAHPLSHTHAWVDQTSPNTATANSLVEGQQQQQQQDPRGSPRWPPAETPSSTSAPRHQHQNHELGAPLAQHVVPSTVGSIRDTEYSTTEAVLSTLGRLSTHDNGEPSPTITNEVAPFHTPPPSTGSLSPHPSPSGSKQLSGSGLVDKELSAILREGERNELFADSVHSFESPFRRHEMHSDHDVISRAECLLLLETMEARLRGEYRMAIQLLSDRVRLLEDGGAPGGVASRSQS